MILTCPNCGTQYVVKDGAIPPQGRQVRCASCKHSWHQDPEPQDAAAVSEPEAEPETFAEATLIEPRSGPEAEERAYEEAMIEDTPPEEAAAPPPAESWMPAASPRPAPADPAPMTPEERGRQAAELAAEDRARDLSADPIGLPVEPVAATPDWREPPQAEATDDEFSPFPAYDEEPRRRSPLMIIAIVLLVVAIAAAALYFFVPPELKARIGLAAAGQTPLALVATHLDRQKLESGNELLTVTGRVINPTEKEQDVPPVQAQLRSKTGKVIYSWTIAPPTRSLPAGASASFNSAELNVPPGGDDVTFRFGEPRG